jgi:hypothetical protein
MILRDSKGCLISRGAEILIINEASTGAADDLDAADRSHCIEDGGWRAGSGSR